MQAIQDSSKDYNDGKLFTSQLLQLIPSLTLSLKKKL